MHGDLAHHILRLLRGIDFAPRGMHNVSCGPLQGQPPSPTLPENEPNPMKQRYAFTSALVLSLSAAVAQPTLNAGSANPIPGDVLTFTACDHVEPGPAGANVTWDHSGLSVVGSNTITYIQPSASGLGGTFPNATVAQDEGDGNYLFYKADASGFADDGFVVAGFTGTCTDPLTLLAYPMNFNGTFTDNSTCSVTDGNTTWARTATNTGTADAHGNIMLPFGTVNNVLRVHTVQNMIDNQYDPPSTVATDTYAWYRPGVHGSVFAVTSIQAVYFGFPLNDSSSTVIDGSAIGLDELLRHDIGVELWPNPATDRVEVVYGLGAGHALTIDLLDVTGQVVRHLSRSTRAAGVQREFLSIADLSSGAYLVRITDDTGALGMQRLVKP